jgi:hypothetical protein
MHAPPVGEHELLANAEHTLVAVAFARMSIGFVHSAAAITVVNTLKSKADKAAKQLVMKQFKIRFITSCICIFANLSLARARGVLADIDQSVFFDFTLFGVSVAGAAAALAGAAALALAPPPVNDSMLRNNRSPHNAHQPPAHPRTVSVKDSREPGMDAASPQCSV